MSKNIKQCTKNNINEKNIMCKNFKISIARIFKFNIVIWWSGDWINVAAYMYLLH